MALSAPVTMPRAAEVLPSRSTVAAGDVDDAHATISALFCEHRLDPVSSSQVRMRLRSAHASGVGLEMLDYGEAVRISPVALGTFHLVQVPLTGHASMQVGNAAIDSSPGVATVPPIDRPFTMTWDADTPHLIVFVERSLLESTARNLYGLADPGRLTLAPQMRLDTPHGRAFLRAAFEMHDVLEHGGGADGYAQRLAAELLTTRMLDAIENSVTRSLSAWDAPVVEVGAKHDWLARRFLDEVDAAVEAGRSVLDIADALGVPVRTLQEHVRASDGRTPSAVLRDARFRRARELLMDADPARTTVTTIAQRCGFGHLGRFAMDYRARFGESPTATLHR